MGFTKAATNNPTNKDFKFTPTNCRSAYGFSFFLEFLEWVNSKQEFVAKGLRGETIEGLPKPLLCLPDRQFFIKSSSLQYLVDKIDENGVYILNTIKIDILNKRNIKVHQKDGKIYYELNHFCIN